MSLDCNKLRGRRFCASQFPVCTTLSQFVWSSGTAEMRSVSFTANNTPPPLRLRSLRSKFRILDTSAPVWDISVPRQIGTRTIQHLKKTNRPFFNHVCSRKDPDHADNTVTLYTTVVWHCEIKRSFSAPSILSCFWAFTQNFLNMACTRFRKWHRF